MNETTKRRFEIDFTAFGDWLVDSAVIELEDIVITRVDDEWRDMLYDLHTPEQIAEHIAYNLIINKIGLSQMDGWADMPNEYARVIKWPTLDDFELEARALKVVTE